MKFSVISFSDDSDEEQNFIDVSDEEQRKEEKERKWPHILSICCLFIILVFSTSYIVSTFINRSNQVHQAKILEKLKEELIEENKKAIPVDASALEKEEELNDLQKELKKVKAKLIEKKKKLTLIKASALKKEKELKDLQKELRNLHEQIDKANKPVITFAPVKNSDCDKTEIGKKFLAQFNKRAVNPKRARFTNEYIEELPDLRYPPKTFELQGESYKRSRFNINQNGHNDAVKVYYCKSNCTNLVLKTGIHQSEALKTMLSHESEFATKLVAVGREWILLEDSGENYYKKYYKNFTESQRNCVQFLMIEELKIVHQTLHMYHCDIDERQVTIADYKINIIDWEFAEYLPQLNGTATKAEDIWAPSEDTRPKCRSIRPHIGHQPFKGYRN